MAAKPKSVKHTKTAIKKRAEPHAPGTRTTKVDLAEGESAWHPFEDGDLRGPLSVTYFFGDDGEVGVITSGIVYDDRLQPQDVADADLPLSAPAPLKE